MVKTGNLSELCRRYGVSAAKLSRLSGKSPSTLYRWYAEENPILKLILVGAGKLEKHVNPPYEVVVDNLVIDGDQIRMDYKVELGDIDE